MIICFHPIYIFFPFIYLFNLTFIYSFILNPITNLSVLHTFLPPYLLPLIFWDAGGSIGIPLPFYLQSMKGWVHPLPMRAKREVQTNEFIPQVANTLHFSFVGPTWILNSTSATCFRGSKSIPCMVFHWWLSLWETSVSRLVDFVHLL